MKAYVPGGTSQPHSIALLPNHASFCSSYLNSPSKALKAGSKFLPCSVEGESLESFPVKNQVLVYVKLQLQVSVQLPSSGLHATDKNRKEHLFLALLWVVTVATALRRRTQAELLPTLVWEELDLMAVHLRRTLKCHVIRVQSHRKTLLKSPCLRLLFFKGLKILSNCFSAL